MHCFIHVLASVLAVLGFLILSHAATGEVLALALPMVQIYHIGHMLARIRMHQPP